jgi:hypothetical protein
MKRKFTQEEYIMYPFPCQETLKILEDELRMIEKSGKKPMWYYSAEETVEHLRKEKGANLTPYDVNNIFYVLLKRLTEKKFIQEAYRLHFGDYRKILKIMKREVKAINESKKKSLWSCGLENTFKNLKKKKGASLTPSDINYIINVLLKYVKE